MDKNHQNENHRLDKTKSDLESQEKKKELNSLEKKIKELIKRIK